MIKLIAGLGNPGTQYERTRHNVGFLFLDYLIDQIADNRWSDNKKFNALTNQCSIGHHPIYLIKPQTFMNRSGQAVAAACRYYNIDAKQVLVVHDELDFQAGTVKLKSGGGHGGHNGLRDIIAHMNSKDFHRLRIGIGRPSGKSSVSNYVLSSPSKQELTEIENCFCWVEKSLQQIIFGQINEAMNTINSGRP